MELPDNDNGGNSQQATGSVSTSTTAALRRAIGQDGLDRGSQGAGKTGAVRVECAQFMFYVRSARGTAGYRERA